MVKSKKQKALDEELLRECEGYRTTDIKPDGAYIQIGGCFYNINKIKRLIEAGANVRVKTNNGFTPLHYASGNGYTELAKLLIEAGAIK